MYDNAERFQKLLAKYPELSIKIQEAARSFTGDTADDRAVFEAVIAPVAREAGIELTYAEARRAALGNRELTDLELELVVGGAGPLYSRIIAGTIAATMTFTSIPAAAFARQVPDATGRTVQVTHVQESTDDTDAGTGVGFHKADPSRDADLEGALGDQQQAAYDAINSCTPISRCPTSRCPRASWPPKTASWRTTPP